LRLAEQMGCTVGELSRRMTVPEFREQLAYHSWKAKQNEDS
jgi:hypothetical protein